MKKLFCLILIFTTLSTRAQNVFSIVGSVVDNKGEAIPGATVFVANSKYIMATNNQGEFRFDYIPRGTYEVVVKMLGFNSYIQNVAINEKTVKIFVQLTENPLMLNEVNINAGPDPQRAIYLSIFIKNFVGESLNAQKCKLLNPEVLKFHLNKNSFTLQASAPDFLIIENRALGYTLKYLLTSFEFNFKSYICKYSGYSSFEELKADAAEQVKWNKNRRVAYVSSERYFFKSLVNNTLDKDGFIVYALTNEIKRNNFKYKAQRVRYYDDFKKPLSAIPLSETDSLFITEKTNHKKLESGPKIIGNKPINTDTLTLKELYVVYTGEKESPLFFKTGSPINLLAFIKLPQNRKNNRQISKISPLAQTVIIERNGGLTPAIGFNYWGYWGWQRIADSTPLDYNF